MHVPSAHGKIGRRDKHSVMTAPALREPRCSRVSPLCKNNQHERLLQRLFSQPLGHQSFLRVQRFLWLVLICCLCGGSCCFCFRRIENCFSNRGPFFRTNEG